MTPANGLPEFRTPRQLHCLTPFRSINDLPFRDKQPAFASGKRWVVCLLSLQKVGKRIFPTITPKKTAGKLPSRGTLPAFRMSLAKNRDVSHKILEAPCGAD